MSRLCAEGWNRRRRLILLQEALGPNTVEPWSSLYQTIHKVSIATNVVKLAPEIGVGKGFRLLPANFLEHL